MTEDGGKNTAVDLLFEGERVDDLQLRGLKLIQSPAAFCFGTDSVLLAHFALEGLRKASGKSRVADLGAGSGALSFLIHGLTSLSVTAIEIDEAACSRIGRSCLLNGLDESAVAVVNADITDPSLSRLGKFDYAVCNPPYFSKNCGKISAKGAATHELSADIAGVAKAAAQLLRFGGRLDICFPAERLSEAFCALSSAGLEPKKLRLVQTKPGARPYLALIRANRGAKPGLIAEANLVITGADGKYTEEVEKYYNE